MKREEEEEEVERRRRRGSEKEGSIGVRSKGLDSPLPLLSCLGSAGVLRGAMCPSDFVILSPSWLREVCVSGLA